MVAGRAWIVGLVVLGVLAGACQDHATDRPTTAAARDLRAAAHQTLAEPSFRVRVVSTQSGKSHTATGEYQAPDRTRVGGGSTDRITIGDTMYQRFGDDGVNSTDPNLYYRTVVATPAGDLPPGADLTALLATAVRKGSVVSRRSRGYQIATPGRGKYPPTTMRFRVTHGRVTEATLSSTLLGQPFVQQWYYSDFGAPISIDAPPAELTRDLSTGPTVIPAPTPKCPNGDTFAPDPRTGAPSCSGPTR